VALDFSLQSRDSSRLFSLPQKPGHTLSPQPAQSLTLKSLASLGILKLGLRCSSSTANPSLWPKHVALQLMLYFWRPSKACGFPYGQELDRRLWILESMTAGGKRIAMIAARRIAESTERIGKDMLAIKAGLDHRSSGSNHWVADTHGGVPSGSVREAWPPATNSHPALPTSPSRSVPVPERGRTCPGAPGKVINTQPFKQEPDPPACRLSPQLPCAMMGAIHPRRSVPCLLPRAAFSYS